MPQIELHTEPYLYEKGAPPHQVGAYVGPVCPPNRVGLLSDKWGGHYELSVTRWVDGQGIQTLHTEPFEGRYEDARARLVALVEAHLFAADDREAA